MKKGFSKLSTVLFSLLFIGLVQPALAAMGNDMMSNHEPAPAQMRSYDGWHFNLGVSGHYNNTRPEGMPIEETSNLTVSPYFFLGTRYVDGRIIYGFQLGFNPIDREVIRTTGRENFTTSSSAKYAIRDLEYNYEIDALLQMGYRLLKSTNIMFAGGYDHARQEVDFPGSVADFNSLRETQSVPGLVFETAVEQKIYEDIYLKFSYKWIYHQQANLIPIGSYGRVSASEPVTIKNDDYMFGLGIFWMFA